MKTIVTQSDVLEFEIKPNAMLDEYLKLLEQDLAADVTGAKNRRHTVCPGCRSEQHEAAFEKFGYTYRLCTRCRSLFVSPRPGDEALIRFFRSARSSVFLRDRVFPQTETIRREKLFGPQAQWVLGVCDEHQPDAGSGMIIGYHSRLLVEELHRLEPEMFRLVVTNPSADLEYQKLDFDTVAILPMQDWKFHGIAPVDVVLAFDILDRCADLEQLIGNVEKVLKPGGLFLANTILISGFDLQVLWERSRSIYPPERLNLLTAEGLTALFDRHGFKTLEFSTPGSFDVRSVQNAIQEAPDAAWPRFIRYLVEQRGETVIDAFQTFLQTHRLSSFGRIVMQKSLDSGSSNTIPKE